MNKQSSGLIYSCPASSQVLGEGTSSQVLSASTSNTSSQGLGILGVSSQVLNSASSQRFSKNISSPVLNVTKTKTISSQVLSSTVSSPVLNKNASSQVLSINCCKSLVVNKHFTNNQNFASSFLAVGLRTTVDCVEQVLIPYVGIPIILLVGTILSFLPTLSSKKKRNKNKNFKRKPSITNLMQGSAKQQTQTSPAINQVTDLLQDNLVDVGVSPLMALSITTSFAAIFTSIIAYVRTKGKKSGFFITSIILQITQLILQIVHVSFPTFEAKNFLNFAQQRLETIVNPTPILTSGVALCTFIRSQAKTWEEANQAINTFKLTYPRTNIDHILSFPEAPERTALIIEWMDKHHMVISYWTRPVIKRLYSFEGQEALLVDFWQEASASHTYSPPTSLSEDEWDSETEAAYETFVNENVQAMRGAHREITVSFFKDLLGEIVGLLAALVVCIINLGLGKNVDFTTISRNWQGVDFLKEKFSVAVNKLSKNANGLTTEENQNNQVSLYIESLNNLLSIPHTTYASRADLREEIDMKCKEVENFLRTPLNNKNIDKSVLFALYNAANAMRVEIQRASKLQTIRQEPRLVLFYGSGAVGKTRTMQHLASNIGKEKYPNIDSQRRAISITARSKYFPLLSGEPIWTVDEVGGSIDYSEEIVFRDLRGLCSSARFGADTAEIQGKDQEATPHVILATCNTHPDEIMQRLNNISGPESVEPSASRMIIYHCVRNPTYGEIDLNRRDNMPYDKTGKMGHVLYYKMRLNHNTLQYETSTKPISFAQVQHEITESMDLLRKQYIEQLELMNGASRQVQSVSHFVINLHGLPKSGKGRACDLLIPQLKTAMNYPVVQLDRNSFLTLKEKFSQRIILICDDVFNYEKKARIEQEQQYMEIFNKYLVPGSVVVFVTNILPRMAFPSFSVDFASRDIFSWIPFLPQQETILPHVYMSGVKQLSVNEPGCLRRIGFTGLFKENATEDSNISFLVDNNSYYEQPREFDRTPVTLHLSAICISFLLTFYSCYFLIILFALLLLLLWRASRCGVKKYSISEIFSRSYEQYQTFLRMNGMMNIVREPIYEDDNVDVILEAESIHSIYQTLNPVPHVHVSRDYFYRTRLPWKIFVNDEVAPILLKIANKMRGVIPAETEAGCLEYVSTMRRLLLAEGHEVSIKANIATVGKFLLKGNTITVATDNDRLEYIPVIDDNEVVFVPNGPTGATKAFTFDEIVAYHTQNTEILKLDEIPQAEIFPLRKALIHVDILRDKRYLKARTQARLLTARNFSLRYYQKFNEAFRELIATTTGRIILALVGIIITSIVGYGLYRFFKTEDKVKRTKHYKSESTTSESEEDIVVEQKRKRGGIKPKERSELTDTERKRRHITPLERRQQQHFKDFMNKTRFEIKEMSKAIPQSVQELPDMNGYNEFKNTIGQIHDKIKKNELFIVALRNTEDTLIFNSVQERDKVLESASRCYALALEKHYFVTVGHMYTHAMKYKRNIYIAADEFGTKLFKCELVHEFTKHNRDISMWHIIASPESKKIPHFPNIKKNFIKSFKDMPEYSDCIIKRYAENKTEQFLYANCMYYEDRIDSIDADGTPYSLENYGFCWFSFCLLALTTYGDCGLPYYNVIMSENGSKQIKITGIHCMGNVKDNMAIGVSAILTQEDFKYIENFISQEIKACKFCEDKNIRIGKPLPNKDESDPTYNSVHEIVWNNDHHCSTRSVIRECAYYFEGNPNFEGKIRKSCGILAQGSEEHSHCHFITNCFLDEPDYTLNQWHMEDSKKWGKDQLLYTRRIASLNALEHFFQEHDWIEQYTMWMCKEYVTKEKKGRKRKALSWWMEIMVHKHELTETELDNLLINKPRAQFTSNNLPTELAAIVNEAHSNEFLQDLPIPNQDTVNLVGSFRNNQSRVPTNDFKKFAFAHRLENNLTKIPFNPNSEEAPEEQKKVLKLNNFGELCARTTQSIQWQGFHVMPSLTTGKVIILEYNRHIKQSYSNLHELTDKEVMYGIKESKLGLDRLQLKKSIGWSMQTLFNVSLKEDVIDLSEEGVYSWKDNPAANFAKQWYYDAKKMVRSGERPIFFYTDLLKMEKLKPEKNYLGRIFCSADFVDILIQRKFLGSFVARSTMNDDCVGVGSNPWVVFNDIARNCIAKKNYFTGDYKRWDKTVPAWLFKNLGDMLDKTNKTTNFSVLFKDMYEGYHVSGHTLYQTFRGMPSGALLTANLNSKLNDFALFSTFHIICSPFIETTYENYQELVYRKFYGDDVIVAVDDSIKNFFTMTRVREVLSTTFGFVLDSSEKDGQVKDFMEWSELSWCSRYPRKLQNYNFFVGALKKITINSMLHYERKNNPSEVYAVQLNNALFEAAAWEKEYFESIVRDVEFIRKSRPELSKYIVIMTYEDYQDEMYTEGIRGRIIRQLYEELEDLSLHSVELRTTVPNMNKESIIDVALLPLEIENLLSICKNINEFHKMAGKQETNDCTNTTDYVSALNSLWQCNEISEPIYSYEQHKSGSAWYCMCTVTHNGVSIVGSGTGNAKRIAKLSAARAVYIQIANKDLDRIKQKFLNGARLEMNMSSADNVPHVMTTGQDVSLTAGSHVFSNTQFAQGKTDLNPVAFSLNNIAQTGAPFDIRDSCKNIYQLEANYTVSGVQGVGTEVFRLSLDPQTRPKLHAQYISMHEDHIPSVDFGVYIGGAAGAIGTLKIGFVKDISKASFTLSDIQQIASQEVSLGQSSTVAFSLRDIRRTGLYRKVSSDSEPYPGIVAIVSNPITNVQRNDSVQYPIQVYSKLAIDYQLATPIAVTNNTNITDILLSNYITASEFDVTINETTICDTPAEIEEYDDCGWNTGKFNPIFRTDNIYAFSVVHFDNNITSSYVVTLPAFDKSKTYARSSAAIVNQYGFGFGKLPKHYRKWYGNDVPITDMPGFTVWSIQKFTIKIGDQKFSCNKILICEFGCVIVAEVAVKQDKNSLLYTLIENFSGVPNILIPNMNADFAADNQCIAFIGTSANATPFWMTKGISNTGIEDKDLSWGCAIRDASTKPEGPWQLIEMKGNFMADYSTLYQWTFVATGNNASSSAAPTGMQRLFFCRPGTTLNSAMPVNAPQAPGILRLTQVLDNFLAQSRADFLTMYFGQDALSTDFEISYKNGVFLVKGATANQIRVSLRETSMLKDIKTTSNPQNISNFLNSGFLSWISSSKTVFINKMAMGKFMRGMQKQAEWGMAAQAMAGLFGGIGSGIQNQIDWKNYLNNQQLNRALQEKLMDMQGQNALNLSKQNFEQQLSLKGLTSTSSQAGNNEYQPTIGLQQTDRGHVLFNSAGTQVVNATGNDIHGLTSNDKEGRTNPVSALNEALVSSATTNNVSPTSSRRILTPLKLTTQGITAQPSSSNKTNVEPLSVSKIEAQPVASTSMVNTCKENADFPTSYTNIPDMTNNTSAIQQNGLTPNKGDSLNFPSTINPVLKERASTSTTDAQTSQRTGHGTDFGNQADSIMVNSSVYRPDPMSNFGNNSTNL